MQKKSKRFTIKKGYVFDKRVFQTAIGLLALLAVASFWNILNHDYGIVSCPADAPMACTNPFYEICNQVGGDFNNRLAGLKPDSVLCRDEMVWPGVTIGTRPPWWVRMQGLFVAVMVLAAFITNHFWHNKGRRIVPLFGGEAQ